MARDSGVISDEILKEKSENFINKLSSKMRYKAELAADSMNLGWLEQIEFSCPFIDDIVRHPKLDLQNEEEIVKIEQAKRITVASIKNLSRNTHFIEKVAPVTGDIRLSKILIERREEAYNTYENRMVYTLMRNIGVILAQKESALQELEIKNDKVLEYAGSTLNGSERLNLELKLSSKQLPNGQNSNDFLKEIENIRARIKIIKQYISSWRTSEFFRQLVKASATYVISPINKTNILLSNTNYNTALNLFDFLEHCADDEGYESSKDSLNTTGDEILKGILDDAFLMNYFVLDSISSFKKEQKEKLSKYAVLMINQQLKRIISILLNNGVEISEDEILKMVSIEINSEKKKLLIGSSDVKKKFQSALDEYLDKTKDYM